MVNFGIKVKLLALQKSYGRIEEVFLLFIFPYGAKISLADMACKLNFDFIKTSLFAVSKKLHPIICARVYTIMSRAYINKIAVKGIKIGFWGNKSREWVCKKHF